MTPSHSVTDRIKKLIALSGSSNPHEAALAAERMQTLLQDHNLTLADIEGRSSDESPLADRERQEQVKRSAIYAWQRDLMGKLAENNFCLHFVQEKRVRDPNGGQTMWSELDRDYIACRKVKRHVLIGRSDNVTATTLMFDYLADTMGKLAPRGSTSERTIWFEGCTETLCERLDAQRQGRVREEVNQTPGLLRLSDLYGSEEDLNYDFRHGLKPGTTAQKRREEEAAELEIKRKQEELIAKGASVDDSWYLARGYAAPSTEPQKIVKGSIQRSGRGPSGWTQKDQREWDRRNSSTFKEGKRRGRDIGLGGAIRSGVKGEIE